jgi:hypothetical protein
MILRRRDDTFERVIREHLGGELFARKGNVDKYFERKAGDWRPWDNVPRELTGDARIAAEKQALALWMDRARFAKHESRMEVVAEKNWKPLSTTLQLWRIQDRIDAHIRTAPSREAVALRAANLYLTRRDKQ